MAMRANCIKEVEQAIGRPLNKAEAQAIEDKISFHVRDLARTDPTKFNTMTEQQRQLFAAQAAMADHISAVDKAAQRKGQNLLAQTRELANQEQRAAVLGGKQPFTSALFERLRQVDNRIKGERNRAFSSIMETIDAAAPKFLGMITNKAAERDFVHEVFGRNTGNQLAAKGAKVWREQMDAIRERQNAAGANIGRLDYGWLPQPHSLVKVRAASADAWSSFVLSRLDRKRYLNEDGTQMNDSAVIDFLLAAHETLKTDGLNKMTPGAVGGASRAAKHDDAHRQIHFKDGDAYLEYMRDFGPTSVFEAMQGSVHAQIKDTVMIEQFGPNSAQTYRLLKDTAQVKDGIGDSFFSGTEFGATPDMVWNVLNGSLGVPVNARFAEFNQGIRNFMVAAKLQATLIASVIGDIQSLAITSAYHGLPIGKTLVSAIKSVSPDYRAEASRMSLGLDSITSDMVTFHTDNLSAGWTSKLANATMKVTLLEGWTTAMRRGFSVEIMSRLAADTRGAWGSDAKLQGRLERYGINQDDWAVWQAAMPEDWRGQKMLTPESIGALTGFSARQKNDAIGKLLGYIQNESEFTSLQPGLMTRATLRQGTQAGSLGGESLRHLTLFKSFGVAMFERHWKRAAQIESTAGKIAYSASLFTGLLMAGAMTNQLMDIINGRDPRDMSDGKFWLQAMLRGGGVGIFGDILNTGLGGDNRGGQSNLTGLLGPVVGTAADIGLTAGSVFKEGTEPADIGANMLRIGYQNTPFIRSWYTKAAFEHAVFHDMQELLSPGYLRRMERRAKKEFNQSFWWQPGDELPDRAPDLGAAVGE
ncbi:hypothetical protein DBR00_11455 [Pseudomonas sp. HMWF032]|uniref:hypothetical protein n=1 Tax=Pseudomonas sp. HMWF032 TaxID=2056866 RepID=UPI000D331A2F|nr:hypothetical protein [Pseudomonas sp. HMWF032]PTS83991.1 hypothetical protein DBR00_11455 [Pseudomonas sp. HMWF032]PTT85346.1 hypothetical protein DBR41_04040 [Pseudomonas sp. HMWF010]